MATVSETLVNDVKSSYGSPYVHYSCTYVSTRADTSSSAVSVALSFKAWLHSSASFLGTGISLIIYARLSGGSWQSVTIKSSSASWSGNTTKYSAPVLTVTGNSSGEKINVEFYVARGDSGGNSGKLGTAKSPKKYSASLPAYGGSGGGGSASVLRCWRYNVGGTYRKAQRYEKIGGAWVETLPRVKVSGVWKKGVN